MPQPNNYSDSSYIAVPINRFIFPKPAHAGHVLIHCFLLLTRVRPQWLFPIVSRHAQRPRYPKQLLLQSIALANILGWGGDMLNMATAFKPFVTIVCTDSEQL